MPTLIFLSGIYISSTIVLFATTNMASLLIIQRQICKVIKKFKFEELERDVMPVFPEISWGRVKSKLVKDHRNFTITNAGGVIEKFISNADLREKDLYDRLAILEVTDVSRHSKRKIWYGYELISLQKLVNYVERREFEEDITKEFASNAIPANVKVVTYNDVTFVYIKEKKKRSITVTPLYFALFLGYKYFFCSKKNISNDFIKIITNTLGYKKSRRIKLTGRDIRSLMRMLWIKQQGVLHVANLNQSLVYEASKPIVKNTNVDYTQAIKRENYAKQCFGEDPPTLESLVIYGPQESVQHRDLASVLPYDTIQMSWEFRSHNVARFLTSLIVKRVFVLPLPHYVANLITLGKNELTLRTD